jgi:flagellar biosynthesis protein FlhF
MNVKRFTGRTSREAMQKVKLAFGDEAVVLSTKPAPEGGVEIMAMGADGMAAIERLPQKHREEEAAAAAAASSSKSSGGKSLGGKLSAQVEPDAGKAAGMGTMASLASSVQDDVRQLAMSTLSCQEYVRERMLKRRQAALKARMEPELAQSPEEQLARRVAPSRQAPAPQERYDEPSDLDLSQPALRLVKDQQAQQAQQERDAQEARQRNRESAEVRAMPPRQRTEADRSRQQAWSDPSELTLNAMVAKSPVPSVPPGGLVDEAAREALVAAQAANASMLDELRAMRAMMKERFETIAFVERLQRSPSQAMMAQRLLDGGFSPVLIRKMVEGMPADVAKGQSDELAWGAQVLQRNLNTADAEPNLEDQTGVLALVGSTGVGKTTTTAKLAALFAAKHGAHNLGLITLDAYRMGAHEQLRSYGRILGVPVHIAHDRAALEDLLELLAGKKLILIDTAGMPQRDARTRELLEMVSHPSIRKLLVINAAAQGDAIEDVMVAYQAEACMGVILSKLDEAVKLGPALDTLIRHKLKILGIANGQRVPEDWHRLTAASLVHRALRACLNPAYRLDPGEVSLVFSTPAIADMPHANNSHQV